MRYLVVLFFCFGVSAQTLNPGNSFFVAGVLKPAAAGGGGGQTVSDDFNRADNADLGANWTVVSGESTWTINGNTAIPSSTVADCTERYSGVSWTDNQSSEANATAGGSSAGAGPGVAVRCASGARTFYRLVIDNAGNWEMGKMVAGTFTSLATGTTTYSAGALIKLSAIGTTITSTYNGSQIDSRTDSSISSGSPGVSYSSFITTPSLDNWVGRDGL